MKMERYGTTEIEIEGMGKAVVPTIAFDEYYGVKIYWSGWSNLFQDVYAFIKLMGEDDRSKIAFIEYKKPRSLKIYWKYSIPQQWKEKKYLFSPESNLYHINIELIHVISKSTKDPARLIGPKKRYQILKRQK